MATFPIKVEKPEMKIMGLNILPMMVGVNKMMPEGMRKKSVVKQVFNVWSIKFEPHIICLCDFMNILDNIIVWAPKVRSCYRVSITSNQAAKIFYIRSKNNNNSGNGIAESVKSCNLHKKGRILSSKP